MCAYTSFDLYHISQILDRDSNVTISYLINSWKSDLISEKLKTIQKFYLFKNTLVKADGSRSKKNERKTTI